MFTFHSVCSPQFLMVPSILLFHWHFYFYFLSKMLKVIPVSRQAAIVAGSHQFQEQVPKDYHCCKYICRKIHDI